DVHVPSVEEAGGLDQDSDGVRLLAGGATRAPDAQLASAHFLLGEHGQNLLREGAELVWLAEEIGLVGGENLHRRLELRLARRIEAQETVVVAEAGQVVQAQARPEPALE